MTRGAISFGLVALLALTGCQSDADADIEGQDGPSRGSAEGDAGQGFPDAAFPPGYSTEESDVIADASEFLAEREDGWLSLVETDWELGPGEEAYRCLRTTVTKDVYVHAMRPLTPLGTHHTVLSVNDTPDDPDGVTECTAFVNGQRHMGGSGVGTRPIEFPDGVAMHLEKGQQLLLNLHLFNYDSEPLEGTSGMYIKAMDEDEVEHRANSMLAGPIDLQIPQGRSTQSGRCTFAEPATIFGFLPHMHQLGVHMKAVLVREGGDEVELFDGPYDFDDQQVHMIDSVEVGAGEHVTIDCTYENDTDALVTWGDSSLKEMCFMGFLRYPEIATSACIQ